MKVQTYDVLFYRGNGFVSKLVKWYTDSEYSHVALVLDEHHIVEINWNYHVKIRHLSYIKESYDIYRYEDLTDKERERIGEFVHATFRKKYDFSLAFRLFVQKTFRKKLPDTSKRVSCSEWVERAFAHAGITLLPSYFDLYATPGTLADFSSLKRISN